jgi:glycosyltransferase involved in cell wall biosynthesis
MDLLESVRLLKINHKITSENFSLLVAGDGWFRARILQEIQRNDISDLVTLVGQVEDVYSFISKLDLLALPSTHQEDLPHVILEAMAFSKPIVGTDVGGIPEQIVNGVTGFLVPPNNPTELAKCLSDLIQDPALRLQMGKNGQKRFLEHFTAQLAVDRYFFEYAKLQEPMDVVS